MLINSVDNMTRSTAKYYILANTIPLTSILEYNSHQARIQTKDLTGGKAQLFVNVKLRYWNHGPP